jgi:peptidyl-prolyl cis-trans isomerase SurA
MFVRRVAALAAMLALAATVALAAAPARRATPAAAPARTGAPAPARATARPAAAANDQALDAVAAMVNDEAVLVSDVEEQLYLFMQQLQQQGDRAMPDSAEIDTLRHRILDQMIDDRLLQGEAKRQAIVVSDAEVERQVDAAIGQAKERIGGEEAYQAQLRKENLTESALRDKYRGEMRKQMMVERLKNKQFPRHTVPMAEAEAYFKAHKEKFPRVPGEVHLQVIQITPQPDSLALAAGLARIQAIRKRLVAGEKFAKVAAETSEDPGSAQSGGDLGFNVRGHMVKEFDDAAFSLKLNEISQPVRSPFGWHLIQVLDRDTVKTAAGRDSLDEAGGLVTEAHVRHILIRVTPNDADVQRAQALAVHVRDEARKGTDYSTLVRRYSRYQGSADPNGDVGFVSLGTLQAQIRAGLDTLEAGQVSDVLVNQSGFNLFKLLERHPEREYALDEVRAQLPDFVANLQRQERYEAWMKTLRAKSQIEYR